jgi:divalent metal cation (Fe/Co/Zn/Cd) transporter
MGVVEESLRAAHRIADDVEETLHERFGPDCTVTVHVEPEGQVEEEGEE